MARKTRLLQRTADRVAARASDRDVPQDVSPGDLAWGARQALAVGLGVHAHLSFEESTWLADELAGVAVPEFVAQAEEARAEELASDQDPPGSP